MTKYQGRELVAGNIKGQTLRLEAPLSLWDGLDSSTGKIIQGDHPNQGQGIGGKILVFAKGLSGATAGAALTDTVRTGHAPLAIILPEADEIVVTASVTAGVLYEQEIPIIQLDQDKIDDIPNAILMQINEGMIEW